MVRNTKILTPKQVTRLEPKVDELRTNLRTAISKGRSIIYIDEVMFTTSSILKMEYSRKFENIRVDYKSFNLKTTAVIAAISNEGGLVFYKSYDKSINQERFIYFCKALRTKVVYRKSTLFIYNLKVHHAIACKQVYKELDFDYILNVAYSPQYQPIETIFAFTKAVFRKRKTNAITNG